MEKSIGMVVIIGVIGLLSVLAVYRFLSQRRQLASGRPLGRFFPERRDGKIVFESLINVTAGGQWCRLLLTLKSAEEHQIDKSPRYFFEKVAMLVGTPYTLTLKDGKNRVVHTEMGSLAPFIIWLGSCYRSTETLFRERSQGSHEGTVTLLDFLPQEAGPYWLSLQITEKVAAEYPGSSSTWEVLKGELSAREGVIPLSKTIRYPHRRVRV